MSAGARSGPAVVLITGAAGGIGSAIARRYVREGASLALLDIDAESLAALADELRGRGAKAIASVCDVTDEEACRRAVAEAVDQFGGIDVLISNAGRTHLSFFDETHARVFRRVMDINFFGALHITLAALPFLRERRGSIAVLSSVAGFGPLSGRSGYAASKHALHGLFESLRGELREHGVSVTMVCPSFTRTGIGASALGGDGGPATRSRTEYGSVLEPADVAEAIVRAVRRRRRLVVLGGTGKLAYLVSRLAPGLYEKMMVRRLTRDRSPVPPEER